MKNAFTLTEVLITITIIAIIAIIGTGNIRNNYNKNLTAIRLQKAYEDINKAVTNGILENGSIEHWDFNLTPNEFVTTYLKTISFDKGTRRISDNTKKEDRIVMIKNIDIIVDINGNRLPNTIGIDRFIISILSNGIVLLPTFGEDGSINMDSISREALLKKCRDDGVSCGALIQHDGWKIKDDYPF